MLNPLFKNILVASLWTFLGIGTLIYFTSNGIVKYLQESRVSRIETTSQVSVAPNVTTSEVLVSIPVTPETTVVATVNPTIAVTASPKITPKPTISLKVTQTTTPTPQPSVNYSKPRIVAPNCPMTTKKCVPCTAGGDCRFEPQKKNGFKGWACQNNNPGNIRNASTVMATDSKNKMIVKNGGQAACGVRYDSRGGSYFVFVTYDIGKTALQAYVKAINNGEHSAYQGSGWKCGNCTLTQFFSKYAPGDPNYANDVAGWIGESSSQSLQVIVSTKLDAFVDAIERKEGFFVQ
ncbi:hypothetical protein IT418_03430 [bacterium]|nr:hypothetical protein [bacterium]